MNNKDIELKKIKKSFIKENFPLDKQEEDLLLDLWNYSEIKDEDKKKQDIKNIFLSNLERKKAISLRPLESDILKVKSIALKKGIPYQTLLISIIHQYANWDLVEKI